MLVCMCACVCTHRYTTKSLLSALGVAGRYSGEASAAINWVIKVSGSAHRHTHTHTHTHTVPCMCGPGDAHADATQTNTHAHTGGCCGYLMTWLQDGAGRLGRLLFARWGRELDCELKQFRLAGGKTRTHRDLHTRTHTHTTRARIHCHARTCACVYLRTVVSQACGP